MLHVLVRPSLTRRCFATFMLFVWALNPIEFKLSSVHLVITEQFVLGTDADGERIQFLWLNTLAFSNDFTIEHPIKSESTFIAKTDGFDPRITLLEKDVFIIGGHKLIFHGIAILVHGVLDFGAPILVQLPSYDIYHGVVLDQSQDYLVGKVLEF